GDLQVLFDSHEGGKGSFVWHHQHLWQIRSWRLYTLSNVYVLETVSGEVVYIFADVSYPFSVQLMERMLTHKLEIDKDVVGNDMTTAAVFNSPMLYLLRVEMVINSPWIMPILGTKELASPEQTAPNAAFSRDIPLICADFSSILVKTQSSRYVVPTGRVAVPTGRYVVPAGNVIIVSSGRLSLNPTGRVPSPGAYDHEGETSHTKRSRHVETIKEALFPNVHHEFLELSGCSREAKSRYNSRQNSEALRKCILSGPYKPTTVLVQVVDATDDSLAVPEHTTVKTSMNMSPENKVHFLAEKEAIHLILTGIGDDIYSTVDACQTAQEIKEAIEMLKQAGMVKQYQNEVNELRAERLARNANPLALVATAQADRDPYYQTSRSYRSQAPSSKPSIPSRSHMTTRHKGKEIAKPITPPSETASKEDSDPKQAQRDKNMQKNLALIEKYFKKIYKPTNNILKKSSNSKNKNVDTIPRYKNDDHTGQFGNQRTVNVAGAREKVGSPVVQQSGIQCFNCKEYGHFAKECRKPKRVKDSAYHKEKMLLCKQVEQGVLLQAEPYDWLADTDEEVDEQELEAHYSYMAKIQEVPTVDSGTDSEPVEQEQNDAGYNVFANYLQHYEQSDLLNEQNDVESDDERVALANLIANLKLDVDENKKIQNKLKKANTTLAQELKECKTNLAETKIVDNAWIKHSKDQFCAPTAQDIEILIQTCLMPLAFKTQSDSFKFVHELKQEMHSDLKYVESLEKKVDELEFDKAEFLEMYDVILQDCVSKDVMCSYLMSLSDLDALDELQCLYLHKVKECDCLAQKLLKQTESISKKVHTELLQRFAKVEKHLISLEIALQKCKEQAQSEISCLYAFPYDQSTHANRLIPDEEETLAPKRESRSKLNKDLVLPISTRKPKSQANKSMATPNKKKVASKSTNQKPQSYFRVLYENTSKAWKWWIERQSPSGYKWVPKPKNQWVPKAKMQWIVQLILFIVDSGCMKHMTGNLKLLCKFVEKFLGTVRFGNDQFTPILGYGALVQENVTINRVYYVEGLNYNLFLVGQFCDADLEVAFRKSTCFVRDLQAWLWHRRLSHLNFDYINLLLKKDIVIVLPKLKYVKDQLCSSCKLSKAKRSSFKSKAVLSSKGRLNLLHMDLCGPMRVASINGKKYILVIVDDYSRYTWTLFLRSKDEMPKVLKDFLTMIQRSLQAPVITVRTDRGTEFLNKTLNAFFKEEGIEHQTSTARTPEQNGVVER
nr:hypothetical protein [Tanacetum cinerariifolium]